MNKIQILKNLPPTKNLQLSKAIQHTKKFQPIGKHWTYEKDPAHGKTFNLIFETMIIV